MKEAYSGKQLHPVNGKADGKTGDSVDNYPVTGDDMGAIPGRETKYFVMHTIGDIVVKKLKT
jgi:hypothetical protein